MEHDRRKSKIDRLSCRRSYVVARNHHPCPRRITSISICAGDPTNLVTGDFRTYTGYNRLRTCKRMVNQSRGTRKRNALLNFGHAPQLIPSAYASYELSWLTMIDCRPRKLVTLPKGHEYVTLSYMWGVSSADDPYMPGSPRLSLLLSQTVEDSIIACTLIGMNYLWIHHYCIPQSDPHAKMEQIQRMNAVFAMATLTLVACVRYDARYWLTRVIQPR
jgi:hypothetical protein